MTGMLMWNVGDTHGTPLDQDEARSTVEPIRTDGELAEAQKAPEWNELDTDESGQLVGLSPRTVGSDTIDTENYPAWWARLASQAHNILVDQQVSSSGTAAKREEAGEQGHGTMQYAIGIEPVIRDGAAYGNDYFVSHDDTVQSGAGSYMTPIDNDNWGHAVAQARANANSRDAFNDSLFSAFLNG